MSSERIQKAVDRIDRALARIETQAALASHGGTAGEAGNAALVARHEALRESVTASLAELDTLIEGLGA
ncbi:hypothetical protein [Qipengyuania sp.]|uniref:hypothetical protein n=1 Tax=Qipengyuania sp. TaxID=2004515 RepID=UPI00351306C9